MRTAMQIWYATNRRPLVKGALAGTILAVIALAFSPVLSRVREFAASKHTFVVWPRLALWLLIWILVLAGIVGGWSFLSKIARSWRIALWNGLLPLWAVFTCGIWLTIASNYYRRAGALAIVLLLVTAATALCTTKFIIPEPCGESDPDLPITTIEKDILGRGGIVNVLISIL